MDSSGKLPTMNEGRVKKGAIRVELDGGIETEVLGEDGE